MKKLKLNANAQGSALNRNELKKVLGGELEANEQNCTIYTIDNDGRRRFLFDTDNGDTNGQAAALRAHQASGLHTYWDCGEREHKYFVS